MPTFKFTSPEGKTYRVNGPEGATQEDAWAILQGQLPPGPEAPATEVAAYRTRQSVVPASGRQQQGPLSSLPGTALGAANEAARQVFETSRRMTEGEPVSAAPTFWAAVGASPAAIGRIGRAAEAAVPKVVAKEAEPPQLPQSPPGITSRYSPSNKDWATEYLREKAYEEQVRAQDLGFKTAEEMMAAQRGAGETYTRAPIRVPPTGPEQMPFVPPPSP